MTVPDAISIVLGGMLAGTLVGLLPALFRLARP